MGTGGTKREDEASERRGVGILGRRGGAWWVGDQGFGFWFVMRIEGKLRND